MICVEEALSIILKKAGPLPPEQIDLCALTGRIAAKDIKANITHPPHNASAMDGYGVRFEEAQKGNILKVIGEAPAGRPFEGAVQEGECVRIFTGGVVPSGLDHIIIQEDVSRNGDRITINESQPSPAHIRRAGVDFHKGDVLVEAGICFHELHGALLASANIAYTDVIARPKVYLFSTGDELREPGAVLGAGEIINSNHYALTAMIKTWGGEPIYGGCLPDEKGPVIKAFDASADIIVPIGGASVGDYDVVKPAFLDAGGDIHFEKIAVRPGKPTWYGTIEQKGDRHRKANLTRIIGLPGNPASAIVTAALFLQPLVRVMAGHYSRTMRGGTAQLAAPLSKNGGRETYLRGRVDLQTGAGYATVLPFPNQDSSLLSPFASANVLIRRMPGAPAALEGETVDIVWLR